MDITATAADKYEKVLIPFSGGLRSLVCLLWSLRRRNEVYVLYVRGLQPWSSDWKLQCIRKILSSLLDYWGDNLAAKLHVSQLSEAEEGDLVGGDVSSSDRYISVLLQKAAAVAKDHGIDKVITPNLCFGGTDCSCMICENHESVAITNSRAALIEKIYSDLSADSRYKEQQLYQIISHCSTCRVSQHWLGASKHNLVPEAASDSPADSYQDPSSEFVFRGSCDHPGCHRCPMYKTLMSQMLAGYYSEPAVSDNNFARQTSTCKRKRKEQ